ADVATKAKFDALARARRDEIADVAIEARLIRRDLLEQRRLAGIAKRASRSRILLEHRDVVSFRHQRCVGQAGGAGADDCDALAVRRPAIRKRSFATGGGIDHAADARPAAHLVDAGIAGETTPDRLAAAELLDPLRIGDEATAQRDEIRFAPGDRRRRRSGIAEPSYGDDWDADQFFH